MKDIFELKDELIDRILAIVEESKELYDTSLVEHIRREIDEILDEIGFLIKEGEIDIDEMLINEEI